jgi:gliding motility-associated-like protein
MLSILALHGQKHEWLATAQYTTGSAINTSLTPVQVVDARNNIYILSTYRGTIGFPTDTISFTPSTSTFASYIAKYDADGNFLWVKNITNGQSVTVSQMRFNTRNQLIIYGSYFGSSANPIAFGPDTLSLTRATFVAVMDTAGNFLSATNIAFGGSAVTALGMAIAPNNDIILTGYHSFGNKCLFDSGVAVNVTLSCCDFYLARFSSDGKKLRWHRSFEISKVSISRALSIGSDNQIYMGILISQNQTAFGISAGSAGNKAGMAWYRGDGTLYKARTADDNNLQSMETIVARDSSFVLCIGYCSRDSSSWNGNKFYKQGPLSPSFRGFHVVFAMKHWDTLAWSHTTNVTVTLGAVSGYSFAGISGNFVFLSLQSNGSTDTFRFGGLKVSQLSPSKICKVDLLGNVLWIIPNPTSYAPPINTIGIADVVYSGVASTNTWTFDPFTYRKPSGTNWWHYVAKTFDYNIVRGDVRRGPYCAGDTLLVPYTRAGDYDTANTFIAEISDPNGNFLGGERELGRLKSNKDSVVTGKLPLFQVASSPNYRIRIRSTHPVVQSFFRLDTLKLLIYSRDKADPGKDSTICKGDTFQLNTFGGTKWSWSPALRMNNAGSRTPLVWPDTSTRYTIIIADSSGCGAPDTASILISVRPAPLIAATNSRDSLVCLGTTAVLRARFASGKADAYETFWRDRQGKILANNRPGATDSFSLLFQSDTLIILELRDNCHPQSDTLHFHLRAFPDLQWLQVPADTQICRGTPLAAKARTFGGKADSVRFVWSQVPANNTLATGDSLLLSAPDAMRIQIEARDRCTKQELKHLFDLSLFPQINAQWTVNPADTLCFGESRTWQASATGGHPLFLKSFHWFLNGRQVHSGSQYRINTDTIHSRADIHEKVYLSLQVDDGCSLPITIRSDSFLIRPPLLASRNMPGDSTVCLYQSINLSGIARGGKNYTQRWSWYRDGQFMQSGQGINFAPENYYANSDTGRYFLLRAVLSDACSYPDSFEYRIFTPDTLQGTIILRNPVLCAGQSLNLYAKPVGGLPDAYRFAWQVNNQSVSSSDSLVFPWFNQGRRDSVYQIRFSLSDACYGKQVLDSIQLRVLRNLTLALQNDSINPVKYATDTLCYGATRSIRVYPFGGNAGSRNIRWFQNGVFVADTDVYAFSPAAYDTDHPEYRLMAVLSDACSVVSDTVLFDLFVREPLRVQASADTLLCFGQQARLTAIGNGGITFNHRFRWSNAAGVYANLPVWTTGALQRDTVFLLVLTDGCSLPADSQYINIRVRPALQLNVQADTICYVGSTGITANASGGIASGYRYSWWNDNLLLPDTQNRIRFGASARTRIKVVLGDGCSQSSDTARIDIAPIPLFDPGIRAGSFCEPWTAQISPASLSTENYTYSLRIGNNTQGLPARVQRNAGDFRLFVVATNSLGCSDSTGIPVTVWPKPDARFSFSPEKPDLDDADVRFFPQMNRPGWLHAWWNNDTLFSRQIPAEYTFSDTGNFRITHIVSNENLCADTVEQNIYIAINYRLFMPGAFTPNNDGLNDVFLPVVRGINSLEYTIYNRWGQRIFLGNESTGWDGTFAGTPVPEGVYVVLLSVTNRYGHRYYQSASIVLLR